jgi:hypothetical protein
MSGSPIYSLRFARREASEGGIWEDPRAEEMGFEEPWSGAQIEGFFKGSTRVVGISDEV